MSRAVILGELSRSLERDRSTGGSFSYNSHMLAEFLGTGPIVSLNINLRLMFTLIFRRLQLKHPSRDFL